MAEGFTAAEQLDRLLHILPAASRDGGATPEELASALGVDAATVLRDLEEVTTRAYYHPAGGAEDLQVTIEPTRVRVWTGGAFQRPVKLSPLEAVCLALGLRGRRVAGGDGEGGEAGEGRRRLAGGPAEGGEGAEGARLASLLRRVEAHLAVPSDEPLAERFHAPDLAPDPAGVRATFHEGVERRRVVRFRYLKPGDEAPEARAARPYAVAHAEGAWYALAHCEDAGEVRAFRLDRVLDADLDGRTFEPPKRFDPSDYLQAGRIFFTTDEPPEAVVRYSPRVARWIAEREAGEAQADGSLLVRHRVADPDWLVRHVLQYGVDAEVLEPEPMREVVRSAAERMGG